MHWLAWNDEYLSSSLHKVEEGTVSVSHYRIPNDQQSSDHLNVDRRGRDTVLAVLVEWAYRLKGVDSFIQSDALNIFYNEGQPTIDR